MPATELEARSIEKTEVDQTMDLALANIYELALEQYRLQNFSRSREYVSLLIEHQPEHIAANYLSAKLYLLEARLDLALPAIELCIQSSPKSSDFWDLYIDIIRAAGDERILHEALQLRTQHLDEGIASGRVEEADALITTSPQKIARTSKKISKKEQDLAFARLAQLFDAKKYAELESYARKLIAEECCTGFAYRFLGVMYLEREQWDLAQSAMQGSLHYLPDDATAHFNFGLLYGKLKKTELAEAHYRKAIQLDRKFVAAYNNLGNLLRARRQFSEAELILRKLIELAPGLAVAQFNLVNVLLQDDRILIALKEAQVGVARFPSDPDLHNALGSIYFLLRRFDEAMPELEKSITLKPDYADAYNNLGSVHFELKHFAKARQLLEQALNISPDIGDALRCLGHICRELDNNHIEAIQYIRKALELNPRDSVAHASLLFLLSEYDVLPPDLLFREHQRFGELYDDMSPKTWPGRSRDKNKILHIGFVSGDFYNHAVASFIGPILKHFCHCPELALFAYYANDKEDHMTAELKSYFHAWKNVKNMGDINLMHQINEDEIDILFDLSSHTTCSRLTMFGRRAAPVQVSWIGYPGTTGLKNMDYFISDVWLTPIVEQSPYFTEKICNLPSSAPFEPEPNSPPVAELPALKNKCFTFGSFNRVSKINSRTILLWSRLLLRVPGSRLFIGGMPSVMPNFDHFVQEFEAAGVSRDRLEFFGRSSIEVYLDQYKHVDVCLDAFPYNGATTSLHGLWMGVPTLSIKGNQLVSRNGYSLMGQVGLESMVADDDEGFIERGVYWATHLDELADIRKNMRARCLASSKFNAEQIAHYLLQAMRTMWQRWCDELPPEAFEIHKKQE